MSHVSIPVTSTVARSVGGRSPWRLLAAFGTSGPVLFLAMASLGGALTPGYNPVTDTISALELGPIGWLQTLNFLVFGASVIAFGLALHLRFSPDGRVAASAWLLGASGLSLMLAGIFPAVVVDGQPTPSALIHGLAFFGTCLPLPGVYALAGLRFVQEPGWRRLATYSAVLPSSVFFLFAVFGVLASDPGDPFEFIAGLLQRLLLVLAFGWVTVVGLRLLGAPPATR